MAGSVGVNSSDALTCDREPETGRVFKSPAGRQPDAIVEYADFEAVRQTHSRNNNGSAGGAAGDAVTDGILNQRLHDKRRNRSALYFRRDTDIDVQVISKAYFLDGEIVIEKCDFIGQ